MSKKKISARDVSLLCPLMYDGDDPDRYVSLPVQGERGLPSDMLIEYAGETRIDRLKYIRQPTVPKP